MCAQRTRVRDATDLEARMAEPQQTTREPNTARHPIPDPRFE